jgi:hypothetical protein
MRYKKENLFTLQSTFSFAVLKLCGIYIPTAASGAVMTIVHSLFNPNEYSTYIITTSFAQIVAALGTFGMIVLAFLAFVEASYPTDRRGPQITLACAYISQAVGVALSSALRLVANLNAGYGFAGTVSFFGNAFLVISQIGGLFMLALISFRVFKGVLFIAIGGASVVMPMMFNQARELIQQFASIGQMGEDLTFVSILSWTYDTITYHINETSIILLILFSLLYFVGPLQRERKKKA